MWQILISVLIVALAFFFIVKKVSRIIRHAGDPEQDVSCGCGCSGCGVTNCSTKSK